MLICTIRKYIWSLIIQPGNSFLERYSGIILKSLLLDVFLFTFSQVFLSDNPPCPCSICLMQTIRHKKSSTMNGNRNAHRTFSSRLEYFMNLSLDSIGRMF